MCHAQISLKRRLGVTSQRASSLLQTAITFDIHSIEYEECGLFGTLSGSEEHIAAIFKVEY
jgi:hypothetical protein